MGIFKGGALRIFQTFLYLLEFLCAAIILGIFSYFLSALADRNAPIPTWEKAVEGLSGAAVLYLIFAVLLTCCLGGVSVFAFLAILLDVLFIGAMIAIAILTRHGASSCTGTVNTPLGIGPATSHGAGFSGVAGADSQIVYAVSLRTACRLNTAAFAVSIIGAFIFVFTALLQIALMRHHKKEKRYGPSPSNNYTSGSSRGKFWQRKKKNDTALNRDTEMAGGVGGAGGLAAPGPDMRPSHETGYTGSTVGNHNAYDKVDTTGPTPNGNGAGTGYYTAPHTGENPYGYERTTGTATNY